ncbi:MAG: 30S ribosomal protein S4 [Planctomycetes bacterium]|nr:30S ribosomal protein S4 [Planctomycetota bacterium]
MGRYTGPKARVNRRLATQVYEAAGTRRAHQRREQPPGMHTRVPRTSEFGTALQEKQKLKHYYGVGERQLRRYFELASKKAGNTGESLLIFCECRLDNVVRRAGYTRTRPQARQGIVHGHFQVNGIKVTSPSYLLRPGDVITVRPRENLLTYYRDLGAQESGQPLDWVSFDGETLRATMLGVPGPSDISCPVGQVNLVTEFLSR